MILPSRDYHLAAFQMNLKPISFRGTIQLLSYLKTKTKLHPHFTMSGGNEAFHTAKQKGEELTRHTKSYLLLETKGIWVSNVSATVVFLYSLYQSLAVLDNK